MTAKHVDQMREHLGFLGFETSTEDDTVRANHKTKPILLMRPRNGGVLFTSIFLRSDAAKRNRLGCLDMPNAANDASTVARFYADQDSDLLVEAWHPGCCDRVAFGALLEAWDQDFVAIAIHPDAPDHLR